MSGPASWLSSVLAQAAVEARLTARRGENVLAMIGVPIAVLLFVGLVMVDRAAPSTHLPGTLALSIVASGMVNLGIATAYERGYGVLKRLGGSPLGRAGLVTAKLAVVLAIAVLQVIGLIGVAAITLGWRLGPDASIAGLAVTTAIGAAAFAGLGLSIAGTLRPDAALLVTNLLFLMSLGLGGAVRPIIELPGPLADMALLLPIGALAESFAAALGNGASLMQPLAIVSAWAVGSCLFAVRTFSWD